MPVDWNDFTAVEEPKSEATDWSQFEPVNALGESKADLVSKMNMARAQGSLDRFASGLVSGLEQTAQIGANPIGAFTRATAPIFNKLAGQEVASEFKGIPTEGMLDAPMQMIEEATHLPPGTLRTMPGMDSPIAGGIQSVERTLGEVSKPEVGVQIPVFGAAGPLAMGGRALVTVEMIHAANEAAKRAGEVLSDPNATMAEKGQASVDAFTAYTMAGGGAGHVVPGPTGAPIPDFTGKSLTMPEGAPRPRIEERIIPADQLESKLAPAIEFPSQSSTPSEYFNNWLASLPDDLRAAYESQSPTQKAQTRQRVESNKRPELMSDAERASTFKKDWEKEAKGQSRQEPWQMTESERNAKREAILNKPENQNFLHGEDADWMAALEHGSRAKAEAVKQFYKEKWAREAEEANNAWEDFKKRGLGKKSSDDLVKEAIANAKKNGPSPEFRALFGGIDPEIAGTNPEKVAAFAKSLGMEWRPVPKPETPQPKESNALPIREPEAVLIRQPPGNSQEVGARVPGPEEPPNAQGAAEASGNPPPQQSEAAGKVPVDPESGLPIYSEADLAKVKDIRERMRNAKNLGEKVRISAELNAIKTKYGGESAAQEYVPLTGDERAAEQALLDEQQGQEPTPLRSEAEIDAEIDKLVPPESPATKIKQVPEPTSFNSVEDVLKFRETRLQEERDLYKEQIGLTDDQAERLQRLLNSDRETTKFEKDLTPEQLKKFNAFFDGPFNQRNGPWKSIETDPRLNPQEIAEDTDSHTLSAALVAAVERGIEPNVNSDRFISAVIAARRLKELGHTKSDLARYIDDYTTRNSGSQGDKYEFFKSIGGKVNEFLKSQVIDLPEGELGKKQEPTKPQEIASPQSDYDRYQELVKSIKGKSLDEAQSIAKELEQIKNRNGGMPPKAPETVVPKSPTVSRAPSEGKFSVYEKDGRWLMQVGDKRGFGDEILDSKEQAYGRSEQAQRLAKANDEFYTKQAAILKEQSRIQSEKDAPVKSYLDTIDLDPMDAARAKKVLDKQVAKQNKDKTYTGDGATVVRDMLKDGYVPTTEEVPAVAEPSRVRMNRMDAREQEAFLKRQKEAGNKTEYRLERPDGSFFTVLKTEYDYAKWLKDKEAKPEPPIEERGAAGGNIGMAAIFDPANYKPQIEFAKRVFEKAKDFASWSGQMIKQFGETVNEHLRDIWDHVRGITEADRVAKMSVEEFNKFAPTGATNKGYELAKRIGPNGDRAKLAAYENQVVEELKASMQKIAAAKTPEEQAEAFKDAQILNAKKQYFNEAQRMMTALDDVNKGMTIADSARKNGIIDKDLERYAANPGTAGLAKNVRNISELANQGGFLGVDLRKLSRLRQAMVTRLKAKPSRHVMDQTLDAADNEANIVGRQMGNRVKTGLSEVQDRAASVLVAAQFDRSNLARLLAQSIAGHHPEAEAAVRYAMANWNTVEPAARRGKAILDNQVVRENGNGINTQYAEGYLPGIYDMDLLMGAGRPFVIGGKGGGVGTSFKKGKTYANPFEAIADGYKPQSLQLSDLVEHRVKAGERLVNRVNWGDSLRSVTDPTDSKPVVQSLVKHARGPGQPGWEAPPLGYERRTIIPGMDVAVHEGYSKLFDALTGHSAITEFEPGGIPVGKAAMELAGGVKHGMLLFDTFHASRIAQKQMFLNKQFTPSYKKGLSLLEYTDADLNRAVTAGDITPDMAAYARANRPKANLLLKSGLNVGRIQEALYTSLARKIPIVGTFNKWVFEKMTRGAMMESGLIEFDRVKKNNPTWSDEQVAQKVARDLNVYFGNLGRQGVFKSATFQDAARLFALAPQWVESMARSELGGAKQLTIDPIRNRQLATGTLGAGLAQGLVAYFVGTQLLNLVTRHQLTFQNPEKGHKLDAWIPDATGNTGGYFLSPLAVVAELTHDALRLGKKDPDSLETAGHILANKSSPFWRAGKILLSGRDYNDQKIVGLGNKIKSAAVAMLPTPIAASTLIKGGQPGSTQRQLMASGGFKTEPADTARAQVANEVRQWMSKSTVPKIQEAYQAMQKEEFGPSKYKTLQTALQVGDKEKALAEVHSIIDKELTGEDKGKRQKLILKAFDPFSHPTGQTSVEIKPFATHSKEMEKLFRSQLDAQGKAAYRQSIQDQVNLYRKLTEAMYGKAKYPEGTPEAYQR